MKLVNHLTISNDAEVALYRIFLQKKKEAKEGFSAKGGKDGDHDWIKYENLTTESIMYENAYKVVQKAILREKKKK